MHGFQASKMSALDFQVSYDGLWCGVEGSNCDIFLCDHMDSVHADLLTNCRIFIGPVSGAVSLRGCKDCTSSKHHSCSYAVIFGRILL